MKNRLNIAQVSFYTNDILEQQDNHVESLQEENTDVSLLYLNKHMRIFF